MTKTPTVQRCVTIGKNLQSVVEMRLWEGFLIRLKESGQKNTTDYCSEFEVADMKVCLFQRIRFIFVDLKSELRAMGLILY